VGVALLETDRLVIRPKSLGDSEALHAMYGDEAVMRHLGGPFATLERTREFVAAHMRHQERHGLSMWALVERATGAVVGDVGFLADADGIEIGWHLRRQSWGVGYATEAARACLTYGFSELGFARVSAYVETANVASVRVIEKLGMRFIRGGADGVPPWAEYAL
jgi:RimJ/RimL family protein N-acetyltransferase